MAHAVAKYLGFVRASAFLAKYKGVHICEELDIGKQLGAACATVTSAKVGVNRCM